MSYFFISLGTNVAPDANMSLMIDQLLQLSPTIALSRIIVSEAEGFATDHRFLNAVCRLESSLAEPILKRRLNGIEAALGRNRQDPLSKVKDRPADLDILFTHPDHDFDLSRTKWPAESYVRPLLLELVDFLAYKSVPRPAPLGPGYTVPWREPIGYAPLIINSDSTIKVTQDAYSHK